MSDPVPDRAQVITAKWLAYARRTGPSDQELAEAGVHDVYQGLGLPAPQIIWLPSPLAGLFAVLQLSSEASSSRHMEVYNTLLRNPDILNSGPELFDIQHSAEMAVRWLRRPGPFLLLPRHRIDPSGSGEFRATPNGVDLIDQPFNQVGLQVFSALNAIGRRMMMDTSIETVLRSFYIPDGQLGVNTVVGSMLMGQFDVARLIGHEFWTTNVRGAGEIRLMDQKTIGLAKVAQSTAFWWPLEGVAVMTQRPTFMQFDDGGRLHCETGPAVAWADHFKLWYWHGVHVPQRLVEGTLTAMEVLKLPNVEVRRCAVERMGWGWLIKEANLGPIGPSVPDPGNPGHELTLYSVPAQFFDTEINVLVCDNGTVERDGTRRRFGLTVPANIFTPVEAAAWTYGLTAEQYAQAQRRS